MSAVPTGTVTFLFTDIAGSTSRWEHQPEAMQADLARHDAILRAAIERHGGVVFKTGGDAFYAAFALAPAALAAAVDAQRTLQRAAWGDAEPLLVRMAMHTGGVEQRDGDYFGQPLNRVARLLAVGHGGQVLLSMVTVELVRQALPNGVSLRDLGEHRLKDLVGAEHVFQLVVSDLLSDFPPLRTLDVHPHNLPAPPTPLIGREREVEALTGLMRGGARLVTLTGPGGTGKTRLALQVAAELLDAFADGVFFVALAPLTDPGLVISTIAQTLGLRELQGRPLVASVKDFLRDKALLLVLDNFEQIVAAAPVVSELLATCPTLKVLVTSRVVLHLRGEKDYAVPPLALPDARQPPPLERLTQYEAVRLFIERARDARTDFAVTHENAPAVVEICHRLDGLPLAIELAAVRVRILTPQAMLGRLGGAYGRTPLQLLTGGARDAPARQQTLRDTIAWSYDLLPAAEQILFRRLAVFVGGCALDAAEAVCGASGEESTQYALAVLDGIASLVDQSLLRQEDQTHGEPRFGMFETIREYGLEQLELSGEADAVRRQHAAFFLALAEESEPKLHGPEQTVWVRRLEGELDNVRAALHWLLRRGEAAIAMRLVGSLPWFWQMGSHVSEGRPWAEGALALPGSSARTPARAKALTCVGHLARLQGDNATARVMLEESVAIWREQGDPRGLADALSVLGDVRRDQGDHEAACTLLEECLALRRAMTDTWGIPLALMSLGLVAADQGGYVEANARLDESAARFEAVGDLWGRAQALNNLGDVARRQGEHERAGALYAESLALLRDQEEQGSIPSLLHNLGYVALQRGDSREALRLFRESLRLFGARGDQRGIAESLAGLGGAWGRAGQPQRSARLFGAAEALLDRIGATMWPSNLPDYQGSLAAVRAALDEETFVAAWAAGRTLSLDEASAMALEEAVYG